MDKLSSKKKNKLITETDKDRDMAVCKTLFALTKG